MYQQISSNKRKSVIMIVLFAAFVILLGFVLGEYYGDGAGRTGIFIAGVISLAMALVGYYKGDAIALRASGARPIAKKENPYLVRMVENLAITAGLPMPKVYVIDDSAINAFATGRDPRHGSIAVTAGALEKLENEELEGVLAHELSHIKNFDIRVMTLVIVLVGIVVLLSDWMMRVHLFSGGHRDRGAHPIIAVIAILSILLSPIIAQLIKLAVSRKREFLADASGALLTRYPEGLARALQKIARENTKPMRRANHATAHLFLANPFGESARRLAAGIFSTHPPVEARVRALRSMLSVS